VLAYQAYDRDRTVASVVMGVLALAALGALVTSIRRHRAGGIG
jgi:hypothetical protein